MQGRNRKRARLSRLPEAKSDVQACCSSASCTFNSIYLRKLVLVNPVAVTNRIVKDIITKESEIIRQVHAREFRYPRAGVLEGEPCAGFSNECFESKTSE